MATLFVASLQDPVRNHHEPAHPLSPEGGGGCFNIPEMKKTVKRFYPTLLITLFLVMPALYWWIPLESVQECRSALVGESWLAGVGMILLKEGLGRRLWNVIHTRHSGRLKRYRHWMDQVVRYLFVVAGSGLLLVSTVDMVLLLWY